MRSWALTCPWKSQGLEAFHMGSQEQWGRQGEVLVLYFVTVENLLLEREDA